MIWPDFTTLCGFTLPVYQDVLSKNQSVFDMLHLKRERETVKEKRGGGERNEIYLHGTGGNVACVHFFRVLLSTRAGESSYTMIIIPNRSCYALLLA